MPVEIKDPSGQFKTVMVPVMQYVTGRLRKYKAQGPDGIRYEHYLDMPAELLELYVHHALNDFLPDGIRPVFSSGLQLAGDKEKKDENGLPLARPIVIPSAIERFSACVMCAQLKSKFAKALEKVRQCDGAR